MRTLIRLALNGVSALSPRLGGKLAFALFCRPLGRGKVRQVEQAVDAAARRESLVVNGKRVVVYRWGSGERPVLLVHGWQSRASRYAAFVVRLLELGFSPIAFDAPGHGESTGTRTTILEYEEIMRTLDSRHGPFEAVVAHSFGVISTFHALRSGVRARRLVAISGVCEFTYLLEEFTRQVGLGHRAEGALRRRVERLLAPGSVDIWTRFSASYDRVPAEVLVIHDEDDQVVQPSQAKLIAAAHDARLVITQGLGHRKVLAEPAVLEPALAFLAAPADSVAALQPRRPSFDNHPVDPAAGHKSATIY